MSRENGVKRSRKTGPVDWGALSYTPGFHSYCSTEAVEGALPVGQNSPQSVPFGLFAEQLSGSAFTCPRATNRRSWLYRLAPSVSQGRLATHTSQPLAEFPVVDPNPRRWSPLPLPSASEQLDFVDGLQAICGAGSPSLR